LPITLFIWHRITANYYFNYTAFKQQAPGLFRSGALLFLIIWLFYPFSWVLNADRDKIGSVICNLLTNAVKYSPKGKLIWIDCSCSVEEVIVSVKDKGMGVKGKDRHKIFDRYYRVESDQTKHISGFGIGSYLGAEIIRRHEGKIWVESESGQGSTFAFRIPLNG